MTTTAGKRRHTESLATIPDNQTVNPHLSTLRLCVKASFPLDLADNIPAFQEIRQFQQGRGTMEEIRSSQRLERRSSSQTPHGQWRTHQHPRFNRCDKIPRVPTDSWQLCAARPRPKSHRCESSLQPIRSPCISFDGPVRKAKSKEIHGVGWQF